MVDYDPKSFLRVVTQLRGSVIPALLPRILLCTGIGAGAAYLHFNFAFKLPSIAHTLLGVALGLLLVFRTNASYDRFWEGRKLFGALVNRSRDLTRQAAVYIEGDSPEAHAARREIQRLIVMFFMLLKQYLRHERDLSQLGVELRDEEKKALEPAVVRPNLPVLWMTQVLMRCVRAGYLTEQRLWVMDQNISLYTDFWGGAERIMRTPIPFAYAQHIKSFLTLFCLSAPFAMVESMKWFTPLASGVLAFGMFGIDEIGVEIEDPFGYDPNDLPLDTIGKRIEGDTTMLIEQPEGASAPVRKVA
jgi:putative membrane protein